MPRLSTVPFALLITLSACRADDSSVEGRSDRRPSADGVAAVDARFPSGREIFRYDDFGDWRQWTDVLGLNELVEDVSPNTALALGLKVDAEAVPDEVLEAVLADPDLLDDPAVTRSLLELDAVVGVTATVEGDSITRMGITCALCHSTVDDSVAPGIGARLDGWPNRDLAVGTIISLTPGLPDELRDTYASWPAGWFDPRFNVDGISDPVLIPPAYGLRGVELTTYTGEGPISYWNNYVAVVEMGGHGSFSDDALGIDISVPPFEDEVRDKLDALGRYQHRLRSPRPPAGSVDHVAARRGRAIFRGEGRCAECHTGPHLTDDTTLHAPEETGMDAAWAERSTTGLYRTTPLRALWQHPPYFHDGSAETLADVVTHYDDVLDLGLDDDQQADLVAYLQSL